MYVDVLFPESGKEREGLGWRAHDSDSETFGFGNFDRTIVPRRSSSHSSHCGGKNKHGYLKLTKNPKKSAAKKKKREDDNKEEKNQGFL
jgi:hypothetical protein